MAKPRVFVSSTYYDLKYVRERLERFISGYCFEPVLFESDEVFFNPSAPIDESCYKEVENCHMMILIVGGRYGSLASDQKEKYETQFVSITRKEYDTARRKGIPVMVFIEQNVFAEYKTCLPNKKKISKDFKYAFVDDPRVFEFISQLEQSAIKVFSKVDDIEHYFSHQVAGMLLTYLTQLKEKKTDVEIKNAVYEIKVVSQSMQLMVNSIAEKVLNNGAEYQELIKKQNCDLIDLFFELVKQNIISNYNERTMTLQQVEIEFDLIYKTIKNELFNKNKISGVLKKQGIERVVALKEIENTINNNLKIKCGDGMFQIFIMGFVKQLEQILNLIDIHPELSQYFDDKMKQIIREVMFS
jgi:hypothetical protein